MPSLPLLHGLTHSELVETIQQAGQPAYRADQVWNWLYTHHVVSWEAMSNLPADLRSTLAATLDVFPLDVLETRETRDAGDVTAKLLCRLRDGECIEEVIMPVRERAQASARRSLCISSQVGCRFRCAFCASGQTGLRRNLETGELVAQVVAAARWLGNRPTHVVFMGIGEPLDNMEAVLKAIHILNDPRGFGIGARRMTISTSGIIPGIRRLAEEGIQVELSVSLHAVDDALRSRLMPVNRLHPVTELLACCKDYAERTGRIITFEYTLIRGVNDSPAHAGALAARLSAIPCRVNLIPLSPVDGFHGDSSTPEAATRFQRILENNGFNTTCRLSRGAECKAACGQLRARRTESGS